MTRPIWLVVAVLGGACGATTETVERDRASSSPATTNAMASSTAKATSTSCKVEPPIAVTVTTRVLARDRYELIATATPTANVDAIDLSFVLPPGATITQPATKFGATRSGESRTLVATLTTTARTSELSAFARFPFDGVTMSRAATVTLGDPPPAPRIRQYALPDGERVREVRP